MSASGSTLSAVTETVCRPVEKTPSARWYIFFGISLALLGVFIVSIVHLVREGTGIWGINSPVAWGLAIVNFVFWIGIAHAGTLFSAFLLLFRQPWRTAINRTAETMTVISIFCALLFPAIHVGRIWLLYWMLPLPNQMALWPNFRSPLQWDLFAVTIYGIVSLIFWHVGLIPDLATLRDRSTTRARRIGFGLLALGWRGSVRHWQHYKQAYLLLAAVAAPLVITVHSIVSLNFASTVLAGWHTTIFPPYFVAGAMLSGIAMVVALMAITRSVFGFTQLITLNHFDTMAKIALALAWFLGYAYATDWFIAWYSGNPYERFNAINRAFGSHAWIYWATFVCTIGIPQLFWIKRFRRSVSFSFAASILIIVGMWAERFVITVTSLTRAFVPASWGAYTPTFWDIATFLGSFGLFFTLFSLFVRYLPQVSIAETKAAACASVEAPSTDRIERPQES